MATISPFIALRPQAVYADKMLSLQSLTPDLNPKGRIAQHLDHDFISGSHTSNPRILDNLQRMMRSGELYLEDKPCMFVYEITENGTVQTGIWTLTDLKDYDQGLIKTHEAAQHCNTGDLVNYRAEVGLEGAPVLLTHRPSAAIKSVLYRIRQEEADSVYYANKVFHRIWAIADIHSIRQISRCFADLQAVYLVDGHHRMSAAINYRTLRKHNRCETGEFDFISSFYMSSEQLKVKEYHRLVFPHKGVEIDQVFKELKKIFSVTRSIRNEVVIPYKKSDFGMFIAGKWYNLMYKQKDGSRVADTALLQEQVLKPMFKIDDPGRDPNLVTIGGADALEVLQEQLHLHPLAVGFTLTAMTTEQIIEAAQQEILLPPRSTWIEPRIPFGIILRKIEADLSLKYEILSD